MNLKRATFLAGTIILIAGLTFLAGWLWQHPLLIGIGPNATAMAPNSAIAFALAGLTLMLLTRNGPEGLLLARTTTIVLALLSLARLLEFSLGQDWGVDEFFVSYSASLPAYVRTGMASVSAINFLLVTIGFVFLLWRGRIWAGDVLACSLAIVAGIVGLVFIAGYAAGEPVLFAFDSASMAITTAALFVVLAVGLLCAALTDDFAHTRDPFLKAAKVPIEKKLSAGAGAALGVVVLMGLLSYNNTVKFIESSRWVETTQRMLAVLEGALSNLSDAESGERGYVLTGQESFLEPHFLAVNQCKRRLQQLVRVTTGNPEQQERVARLIPLVNTRLEALRRVVALRRGGNPTEAVRLIADGEGRHLMGMIRAEAAALRSAARVQLAERAATREASRTRTLFTFAAAAIVVALILLGVHLLLEHDLSGRRAAEEALRRHNDTLRGFAHTVAHDLRAPLRGIGGYAHELNRHHGAGLDARGRFCVTQIAAAAVNLEQLIQDTLDFARLDGESVTIEDVDLRALIGALLQQREPQIRERGAEVTATFGATHLPTWKRGLEQVLANVFDNALKYSRHARPPRIGIETAATAGGCLVTVRDNGIGFDPRHHDRIFGLFQRLVGATEFEGTGAGLAIAKKITDRLGGTIRADATPGAGAAFFIALPRADRSLAG
jgi:signal transduction histidine kinase